MRVYWIWAASIARCRQWHEGVDRLCRAHGGWAGACLVFLATALRQYWAREPRKVLHCAGCLCLQNACRRGGAGWGCCMRQGGRGSMPGAWPDSGAFGPGKTCGCAPTRSFCASGRKAWSLAMPSVCAGGRHAAEARVLLDPGAQGCGRSARTRAFVPAVLFAVEVFNGWGWGVQRCGLRACRTSLSAEPY